MGHCDGLTLCMWSTESSLFAKLVLWNPLTRKINLVQPSPIQRRFRAYDSYGLGYDTNKPQREYKILKFSLKHYVGEVEIFDCNTKSWKILDVGKVDRGVRRYCNGVSVDGNMYWLGRNQKRNYILGFDFSLEKFNDIYLFPCDSNYPDEDTYLGGYNGDCLSLVEQNQEQTSPIVVSVSSKLANGNVSFTKYFSVARPDLPALRNKMLETEILTKLLCILVTLLVELWLYPFAQYVSWVKEERYI
ncbi:PREDICTED: putative F-box protein At3g10430 [Brassica oleracea var. oleracea]|uniref:putative F-box protein At3g10430 n=1 Tax=Brassica oleracea var. oleracea TaxID=109376 RepID=UPI0006A6B887|nr:PREDICTED: putative F-box protein At3g10430 [Brassica oleracea var. oleracea]